jgi:rhamnopyranosyl-N-acetylglucosaminyl-diphospho-decaprenol beta-1,3/1,4-galactofuranosyltransferase
MTRDFLHCTMPPTERNEAAAAAVATHKECVDAPTQQCLAVGPIPLASVDSAFPGGSADSDAHSQRVAAVVVTYNRRRLLGQCLDALCSQTRPVDAIYVIDNGSTDGTEAFVNSAYAGRVVYDRQSSNLGGSGGFHVGMKLAYDAGYDWLWLMDDDTHPGPVALAELLRAIERYPKGQRDLRIAASRVIWSDGSLHPLNIPEFSVKKPHEVATAAAISSIPIRAASFVSILVSRPAVTDDGLPISGYFIWNDDIEYTGRILRAHAGIWVPTSIVTHATTSKYLPVKTIVERYRFELRNKIWMLMYSRAWDHDERLILLLKTVLGVYKYIRLTRGNPRRLCDIVRALTEAFTRRPAYAPVTAVQHRLPRPAEGHSVRQAQNGGPVIDA